MKKNPQTFVYFTNKQKHVIRLGVAEAVIQTPLSLIQSNPKVF